MTITYDMGFKEWWAKYKVHYEDDSEILGNTDEHYVWTQMSAGGEEGIVTGFYWVNSVDYYISEIPWETEVTVNPHDESDW